MYLTSKGRWQYLIFLHFFVSVLFPVYKYEVQTYTADALGADTDANVYITLFGERGDSGRRLLHQSDHRVKFEQGQVRKPRISINDLVF